MRLNVDDFVSEIERLKKENAELRLLCKTTLAQWESSTKRTAKTLDELRELLIKNNGSKNIS